MSMKVKHWGLYSVQHATGAHDASYLWDIDFALPALLQVLELLQEDLSEGATDHVLVRLDVDVEQIVTELRVGSHERVRVASQVRACLCWAERHKAECRIARTCTNMLLVRCARLCRDHYEQGVNSPTYWCTYYLNLDNFCSQRTGRTCPTDRVLTVRILTDRAFTDRTCTC